MLLGGRWREKHVHGLLYMRTWRAMHVHIAIHTQTQTWSSQTAFSFERRSTSNCKSAFSALM